MKFLEKLQEMIEMFDSHVFDTKVVNYETVVGHHLWRQSSGVDAPL